MDKAAGAGYTVDGSQVCDMENFLQAQGIFRHLLPESSNNLFQRKFLVTKIGKNFEAVAKRLFGKKINFEVVRY